MSHRRTTCILLSLDRSLVYRLGLSRLTYRRWLRHAGARTRVTQFSESETEGVDRQALAALLDESDGLVLSGGGDVDPARYGSGVAGKDVNPLRDRHELALLAEAEKRKMPILAICRGAQLVNVARGGTLANLRSDPEVLRRHARLRRHSAIPVPGSRLAETLEKDGPAPEVVSLHGLAVARAGRRLEIAARAPDGVAEAIESTDPDETVIGVQWHPELAARSWPSSRLARAFVAAAADYRSRARATA